MANHSEEFGVEISRCMFVFPLKQQIEYGLQRTNTHRYFDEIIEGFIEKYESNKDRKK